MVLTALVGRAFGSCFSEPKYRIAVVTNAKKEAETPPAEGAPASGPART
jgi:hypothetical protein